MFDFGFSEMMIVGVVALIVLGPERLPLVARKTGEWIGKAQRFVAQVKSDIDRETELSELKRIQDEAKNLANDVKSTVESQASSIESSVKSVTDEANDAGKAAEANSGVASAKDINEVYGWGDASTDSEIMTPAYAWNEPKTFAKRYHSGPSVDELAQEIERLRRELGMRETTLGGAGGRRTGMAPRAKSLRTRIYR